MGKLKLRKEDNVIVVSGKDKGKTGKILRVDREKERVYVEGLNMVKRHQRAHPSQPSVKVGVIEKEGPIHISNVALLDPTDNKPTRIAIRRSEQGQRMRVTKRSGTEID